MSIADDRKRILCDQLISSTLGATARRRTRIRGSRHVVLRSRFQFEECLVRSSSSSGMTSLARRSSCKISFHNILSSADIGAR